MKRNKARNSRTARHRRRLVDTQPRSERDWDYFAFESGDEGWGYQSVLDIYRRIEDFHGNPDPDYRGAGGPVYVTPAPDPNPLAPATIEAARAVGIPTFENQNGRMQPSLTNIPR